MQEYLDYVIVEKSSANATGGAGLATLNDGVFIGTKRYFFFIPAKMQEMEYRKITTSTLSYGGKSITQFIVQKAKELEVNDFENLILNDLKSEIEAVQIVSLDGDIEQFKVMAGFFGGGIIINETKRKVGWKPFVNKLGKNKKEIKRFYMRHPKLKN